MRCGIRWECHNTHLESSDLETEKVKVYKIESCQFWLRVLVDKI